MTESNSGQKPNLALLEQRYNSANIRSQIKQAELSLKDLSDFRSQWENFTKHLRNLAGLSDGGPWPFVGDETRGSALLIDRLRLRLQSQLSRVFPGHPKDPLNQLLDSDFRLYNYMVYQLIGEVEVGEKGEGVGGRVNVHIVESTIDQCESIIDERRYELENEINRLNILLDQEQQVVKDQEAHELAVAAASAWTLKGLGRKIKGSIIGKFFIWLFEDRLRKWIGSTILAGLGLMIVYATPPLREGLDGFINWIRSWFSP